jgi:hypothetical protein
MLATRPSVSFFWAARSMRQGTWQAFEPRRGAISADGLSPGQSRSSQIQRTGARAGSRRQLAQVLRQGRPSGSGGRDEQG